MDRNLIVRKDHNGSMFMFYVVDQNNPAKEQHKGFYSTRNQAKATLRNIIANKPIENGDLA